MVLTASTDSRPSILPTGITSLETSEQSSNRLWGVLQYGRGRVELFRRYNALGFGHEGVPGCSLSGSSWLTWMLVRRGDPEPLWMSEIGHPRVPTKPWRVDTPSQNVAAKCPYCDFLPHYYRRLRLGNSSRRWRGRPCSRNHVIGFYFDRHCFILDTTASRRPTRALVIRRRSRYSGQSGRFYHHSMLGRSCTGDLHRSWRVLIHGTGNQIL